VTRRRMSSQKKGNTQPELLLRKALRARGLRFEVDKAPLATLRRRADVVFPDGQVAVFVHGCFWHGCPTHSRPTKSNTKWWAEKIERNKSRDAETAQVLTEAGWLYLEVWEHEPPTEAARAVEAVVRDRVPTRV
jgi:DNA mismatch endonuclease (patch repair protein)